MKPDLDLMRKILLLAGQVSSSDLHQQLSAAGYTHDQVGYQVHLLEEANLVTAADVRNTGNAHPNAVITGLTTRGYEFAELIRDEGRWRAALITAERSGGITLSRLSAILAQPKPTASQREDLSARPVSTILKSANVSSAEAWRSLSAEFGKLADDESRILYDHPGTHPTKANCMYGASDPPHGWIHVSASVSNEVSDRFKDVATRAGIANGCPKAVPPAEFWVHSLYQDLLAHKSKDLFHAIANGGIIPALIRASATYCTRLATEAEEHRHGKPAASVGLGAVDANPTGGISAIAGHTGRDGTNAAGGAGTQDVAPGTETQETSEETDSLPVSEAPKLPGQPPRRVQDVKTSQARVDLCMTLSRDLAMIKRDLAGYCTPDLLKARYPDLALWAHLEPAELKELTGGAEFKPRAYAENLTLRKFGLTSRETLRKDRRKIRAAERATPKVGR